MIYPIYVFGQSVLKKRAEEIEEGTDLTQLISDMYETMYNASGIGLAAPQIGKSIRIFVVDGAPTEEEGMEDFKKVFVNPQIVEESGKKWAYEEGCLSIPHIRENVSREDTITIKYFDENWKECEEEYDGLKARIIQHEYDHLEGILFTDHLAPLKKRILKGRLKDISKGKVKTDYSILAPAK